MKTTMLMLAIAGLVAGCSSEPVKVKEQPRAAAERPRVTQTFPNFVPKPVTQPAVKPRIIADPFNDPNSLLSKRSIYYDFDNSNIKDEYKRLIQAHAAYLAAHVGAKVRIEGNCDERGSHEYNLALGQRRADAVKAAMKLLGTADGQIETASWGEEKPKASGHDESAWSGNRRSDIIYEKSR